MSLRGGALRLERSQRHLVGHPLLLCPRDCSRGVVAKFNFGGKEKRVMAHPKGVR